MDLNKSGHIKLWRTGLLPQHQGCTRKSIKRNWFQKVSEVTGTGPDLTTEPYKRSIYTNCHKHAKGPDQSHSDSLTVGTEYMSSHKLRSPVAVCSTLMTLTHLAIRIPSCFLQEEYHSCASAWLYISASTTISCWIKAL